MRNSFQKEKNEAEERPEVKGPPSFKVLLVVSFLALLVVSGLLFLALFEPPLPYAMSPAPRDGNGSAEFLRTLEALSGGRLDRASRLAVFTNGEAFYPAELEAIRAARHSVHLEAYIFEDGKVAGELIGALTERAKAGVDVKLLLDAVGSGATPGSRFKELTEAGGQVARYHPFKWYTWPRLNNRTHRELLIVDGQLGFTGGAGIADHWRYGSEDRPRWRDMMVRVEGDAVAGLQASFAENWLEATGDVLADPKYFPLPAAGGSSIALVVSSSPTTGRSTSARLLFQTLLASAQERVYISSPYFLPDRGLRDEIARAARERKVEVKVVVPGKWIDHRMVRRSSQRLFGELLEAGAEIYEYQPSMNHTKSLMIDGLWAVVGSSNMDTRSFSLNDEVNVAVRDAAFTKRLERDFLADLSQSRQVRHEEWKRRGLRDRVEEWIGALLERQQ
jgi:cardiolipin synthase